MPEHEILPPYPWFFFGGNADLQASEAEGDHLFFRTKRPIEMFLYILLMTSSTKLRHPDAL